jgi:FkbM family methyltransferase
MLMSFTDLRTKYNMNITGIIHVGGNRGEEIPEYISNGIDNIVIFEPLSKSFAIIEKNVRNLNANILGYQVALGSENKIAEMYVSSNSESSSILKPKSHLTQYTDITFNEKETVEVKKLDDYGYKLYNFINMDVQGYELEVLKGSTETLNYINYVYCEVNREELYENNAFIEEIDQFLSAYNFERVEVDWTGTTWGDALYIKKT